MTPSEVKINHIQRHGFNIASCCSIDFGEPDIFILLDKDGREIDKMENVTITTAIDTFYRKAKDLIYDG